MSIISFLFGSPLASSEERGESVGPAAGIPIFGLDALSSAAYGPEAALTLLLPLGAAGVAYIVPISLSIIVLLTIVFFSYRQTIEAYPGGGGSYTVARENLGVRAGLLAAAALLIDYVLTAAVGISAGVGALVSAVPSMLPHTLSLCLVILAMITLVNLRGVRDTGAVFMLPTYLFLVTLVVAIAIGLYQTLVTGGHPVPVIAPPPAQRAVAAMSAWLMLKVFASGCTAMTGVEAVSNGVKAFRPPAAKTAQFTLTIIIGLLIVLLAGIAFVVRAYGIAATDPGASGYQSVLSMMVMAVAGRGIFYYVTIGSVLTVLALSANTAFADFPRLCRIIAHDGFLPRLLAVQGRRLVYSSGVFALAGLTGLLLFIFGGVTDRLIPLYAVGAFLAFTLSQAGMVVHWLRKGGVGARHSMVVNFVGAFATGVTVVVVLVAKFIEGAWIVLLLIPIILSIMIYVRRQYHRVALEIMCQQPLDLSHCKPPLVVVPIDRWSRIPRAALTFAVGISPDISGLHITADGGASPLQQQWEEYVEAPAKAMGIKPPQLVVLNSPYRFVLTPIVDYVLELERNNPNRQIAVVIPELVQDRWYHYALHNQRAPALKALLYLRGSQRIVVINVPWYLHHGVIGHKHGTPGEYC
jgi:amino acid transporter